LVHLQDLVPRVVLAGQPRRVSVRLPVLVRPVVNQRPELAALAYRLVSELRLRLVRQSARRLGLLPE
jgi:hypothetical protein